ncbi:YcjF family protein [Roseovarius sp. EL26]|uniref:YcjF family protein n=1 Tax=Roseovarius sp. EL26 TaxID=2126672 RepID=UPI000EA25970|nr:TIGR01620 family protein [Roseovarius sp. EL26]
MTKGPVLIDLDAAQDVPSPADAPVVPDLGPDLRPTGQAMRTAAQLAAHRPSRLVRWFWSLLLMLVGAGVSIATWDFVSGLMARNPLFGYGIAALVGAFLLVLLLIVCRELAALLRLRRMDQMQAAARTALSEEDLPQARQVVRDLEGLYANREDTRWGRERLRELADEQFDAVSLLELAESEVLTSLDQQAVQEIEAAARQVATITALVPLALVDVMTALAANLRMIRHIAEIYGGRGGVLGNWRLARAVMAHLVATGAVAVGDDMLEPLIGGGLLGKLSRRFGEGLVNGALTARVGVAALEVCRPLPFTRAKRPSASRIVKQALTGLFRSENKKA